MFVSIARSHLQQETPTLNIGKFTVLKELNVIIVANPFPHKADYKFTPGKVFNIIGNYNSFLF